MKTENISPVQTNNCRKAALFILFAGIMLNSIFNAAFSQENMDAMWGQRNTVISEDLEKRAQLFDESNYGMFIHLGLYSDLGGAWKGKTYYGISENIMHKNMAGIPVDEYIQLADSFNLSEFDLKKYVQLARDAGMKYMIITSKHCDGFAMYHSEVNDFNIVDASPYKRDLL